MPKHANHMPYPSIFTYSELLSTSLSILTSQWNPYIKPDRIMKSIIKSSQNIHVILIFIIPHTIPEFPIIPMIHGILFDQTPQTRLRQWTIFWALQYPIIITLWEFNIAIENGTNRNSWFTELKDGWIFPARIRSKRLPGRVVHYTKNSSCNHHPVETRFIPMPMSHSQSCGHGGFLHNTSMGIYTIEIHHRIPYVIMVWLVIEQFFEQYQYGHKYYQQCNSIPMFFYGMMDEPSIMIHIMIYIQWMEAILHHQKDCWNPKNRGFTTYQLVQDFFHPPYYDIHMYTQCTICLFNIAMERSTHFLLPSISMGHLYHGFVK